MAQAVLTNVFSLAMQIKCIACEDDVTHELIHVIDSTSVITDTAHGHATR